MKAMIPALRLLSFNWFLHVLAALSPPYPGLYAQCLNGTMYTPIIFPNNFNLVTTVNCVTANQYVGLAEIVPERTYRITSSIATDYITITRVGDNAVIAHGPSPLNFVPQNPQVLVHVNTNASCGRNNNCRTLSIQCQDCGTPPVNNNCADAIALTPSSGTECPSDPIWYSNYFSTADGPNTACIGSIKRDVWFKFTATGPAHIFRTEGYGTDACLFEVRTASCPGTVLGACNGDPGSIINGFTPGTEYRIRVVRASSDYIAFTICVLTPPAAPANDNCAGAEALTPTGVSCPAPTNGSTLGGTPTVLSAPACGNQADDDVWYQFTASATAHNVTVQGEPGFNVALEVRNNFGTCGNPVVCRNATGSGGAETATLTGLTIGNTYRMRVFSAGLLSYGAFSICVTTPALPVELIDFDARADAGKVQLLWQTGQERDNAGFGIQRSADATAWLEIGWVPAGRAGWGNQTYLFTDAAPLSGLNYYRLRQADLDGTTTYSPIASARIRNPGIAITPNPSGGIFTLSGEFPEGATLRVFNAAGALSRVQTLLKSSEQVDLQDLSPGFYFLEIQTAKGIQVERIEKL